MSEDSWKCYRCDLNFRDESSADIHREIAKHSVTKID